MKTLYFERAGMDFYEQSDLNFSDVGNHRIRTAFLNDKGERIYLELIHGRVTKTLQKHGQNKRKEIRKDYQGYPEGALIAHVDHCFYIDKKHPKFENSTGQNLNLPCERKVHFLYTLDGILEFVNKEIGCSFDKVEVLDRFECYRVHGDHHRTYNLMDDHIINPERTKARNFLFEFLNGYYNKKFGEKYATFHVMKVEGDDFHIRIYVSEERMKKAGFKNRDKKYSVKNFY